MSNSVINQNECAVAGCPNNSIVLHHLQQLYRRTAPGESFSVISAGKAKRITGLLDVESALRRKQIPLCKEHLWAWHRRDIGPSNLHVRFTRK